jgi:hypothetical protein
LGIPASEDKIVGLVNLRRWRASLLILGRLDRDLCGRDPNAPSLFGHNGSGGPQTALDLRLGHYRFASHVTTGSRLEPQFDPRLIAIGKFHAGGFERQNDLRDRVAVRRLVRLRASNRVSMDASLFRQLADRQIEQASSCS